MENGDEAERWERKAISRISQFLYNQFNSEYEATVEEMYRIKFELCLNIEDTSGNFSCEFPAMLEFSLCTADAVLVVFCVQDSESFEDVNLFRDRLRKIRGQVFPVVFSCWE